MSEVSGSPQTVSASPPTRSLLLETQKASLTFSGWHSSDSRDIPSFRLFVLFTITLLLTPPLPQRGQMINCIRLQDVTAYCQATFIHTYSYLYSSRVLHGANAFVTREVCCKHVSFSDKAEEEGTKRI